MAYSSSFSRCHLPPTTVRSRRTPSFPREVAGHRSIEGGGRSWRRKRGRCGLVLLHEHEHGGVRASLPCGRRPQPREAAQSVQMGARRRLNAAALTRALLRREEAEVWERQQLVAMGERGGSLYPYHELLCHPCPLSPFEIELLPSSEESSPSMSSLSLVFSKLLHQMSSSTRASCCP